ncbi:MAG TPA: YbdK family carboxylate-amine ligase, partial [Mycobacterium sp.]|nr:YbdK family carboxylate-amine ligase [Mycobacterium sp.]
TARVSPIAGAVIAGCADRHGVAAEVMAHMVEVRTPVSRSFGELRQALLARRIAVSGEAARRGALVVPSGVTPLGQSEPPCLTDDARYRALAARFPAAISTAGTMGCHVHVAVPTRAAGVAVLRRCRRWLPALIALSANSPIYDRHDTGWACWRYRLMTRWPTSCPAPPVDSDRAYDDAVAAAIASGEAMDMRNVYYFIRLSPRYPTVEVRVADVLLTADEAAAYAALVRALVMQTLHDADLDRAVPNVDQRRLVWACESAARSGVAGTAVDVASGELVRGWDLVDRLLCYVLPSLATDPDAARVLSIVELLRLRGTGADRQRRLWPQTQDIAAFARSLARWTTARGQQLDEP